MTALLGPAVSLELQRLARTLKLIATGPQGRVRGQRRGSSSEFREHRRYAPSDDFRHIDWHVYARTRQPAIKSFHSEDDSLLHIVLDTSASMGFGNPEKLGYAKQLAAALGYVRVLQGGRVRISLAVADKNGGPRTFGASNKAATFARLLTRLSALSAFGPSPLAGGVATILATSERQCQVLLISDFLLEPEVLDALTTLRTGLLRLDLIQVLCPEELAPTLRGSARLRDIESGETAELAITDSALQSYAHALGNLQSRLSQWATAPSRRYCRVLTNTPLLDSVTRYLFGTSLAQASR